MKEFKLFEIFILLGYKIILGSGLHHKILDGKIKNNKDEALKLLTRLGKSKGLKPIK